MIQMPSFEQGPFGVSERRLIAPPVGLYIPPGVRLYRESATRVQWRPMGGNAVSGYPDMGMREVVVWWRGMPIVMEPKPPAAFANTKETRFTLDSDDKLLGSTGGGLSTAMAASTLYYIYINPDGVVRASATAPLYSYDGVQVLNTVLGARDWLFIGYARTNGSTQFVDTATDRLVINYYNRRRLKMLLTPGYVDDDLDSFYTYTAATFGLLNGGTGSIGSYIANGEDAAEFGMNLEGTAPAAASFLLGIGDDSSTTADAVTQVGSAATITGQPKLVTVPSQGYHTVTMLGAVSVALAVGTVNADGPRRGGATDPKMTCLYGTVMG